MKIELVEPLGLTSYEKPYKPPFQCQYCGRFAHLVDSYPYSTPNENNWMIEWKCKHCGYCKETQW